MPAIPQRVSPVTTIYLLEESATTVGSGVGTGVGTAVGASACGGGGAGSAVLSTGIAGGGATTTSLDSGWVGTSEPSIRFFCEHPTERTAVNKTTKKSVCVLLMFPSEIAYRRMGSLWI